MKSTHIAFSNPIWLVVSKFWQIPQSHDLDAGITGTNKIEIPHYNSQRVLEHLQWSQSYLILCQVSKLELSNREEIIVTPPLFFIAHSKVREIWFIWIIPVISDSFNSSMTACERGNFNAISELALWFIGDLYHLQENTDEENCFLDSKNYFFGSFIYLPISVLDDLKKGSCPCRII